MKTSLLVLPLLVLAAGASAQKPAADLIPMKGLTTADVKVAKGMVKKLSAEERTHLRKRLQAAATTGKTDPPVAAAEKKLHEKMLLKFTAPEKSVLTRMMENAARSRSLAKPMAPSPKSG